MADHPTLFVAGLGRCGTTMMMTMLDAGGFPVTGPRPSYEPGDRWSNGAPDCAWIAAQGGKAVKWIDPTRCLTLPSLLDTRPVAILMERNLREQARSQIKMLGPSVQTLGRRGEKAMERSIKRDTPIVRAKLSTSCHLYRFQFEEVLLFPSRVAMMVQAIIARHFAAPFDTKAAASVVIDRHHSCATDLAMENSILPLIAQGLEARHV